MNFFEIGKLPAPDSEVSAQIFNLTNNRPPGIKFIQRLEEELYGVGTFNMAAAEQIVDDELTRLVKQQYQEYFEMPITASLGYFQNMHRESPSRIPPHHHVQRTTALEYFVELGGPGVRLTLYDRIPGRSAGALDYWLDKDVDYQWHITLDKEQWYAFDNTITHSVEDIETNRLFLAIWFHPEYSLADLTREPLITVKELCNIAGPI
jgi:hypothetical protein